MARKPPNVSWLGFTQEQAQLPDFLDHLGNNGWARNSQGDELMPKVMGDFERVGLAVNYRRVGQSGSLSQARPG